MTATVTPFSTDKFIERVCIMLLILLLAVTVVAYYKMNGSYSHNQWYHLVASPVIAVVLYSLLSLVNVYPNLLKGLHHNTRVINLMHRLIRSVKMAILLLITFDAITTLEKTANVTEDIHTLTYVSLCGMALVLVPVIYGLLQLFTARDKDHQ